MPKGLVDAWMALQSRPMAVRCEFCDRPLLDDKTYADVETVHAGLGITLCTRQDCIQRREAMSLVERLNIYMTQATR